MMSPVELSEWAARYQAMWNAGAEAVAGSCTGGVTYRDADCPEEVAGRDAVRKVCDTLFASWHMTYEVDYVLALRDVPGFLVGWKAVMRRKNGDVSVELSGVDVVYVEQMAIARVESHYDRSPLALAA